MTKEDLINDIQLAFADVKLEDGIGLWQAQGIDDYASKEEIARLRAQDEKNNWMILTYKYLSDCESSLSFFDAKGMRFHLPKFLIFDILEEEIIKEKEIYAPDVLFTLCYEPEDKYQLTRFSLLNIAQVKCVIHFMNYKLEKMDGENRLDYFLVKLNQALKSWNKKLDEIS